MENIRSYEYLEIEFPTGSTLLSGDIGSGKTSILLGLQFALFGLQPGQKGSSLLKQGEDEAYTYLEIEIDGEIISLERKMKKTGNGSITQSMSRITVGNNGEPKELSTSEMKDRVINLLNYPKEFSKKSNLLYKFTVYTPQEEMKSIIQENPEIRLNTLRHIFGIDRYKRIKENASILIQRLKESVKIKEVLISELNLLKEKYNIENEKKIILAKETNNLEIDTKQLIKLKKYAENKLNTIQDMIDNKRELDSELSKKQVLLHGKKDLVSRMRKEIVLMQKQIHGNIDFSEERLKAVLDLLEKHRKIFEEKNLIFLKLSSSISVLDSRKDTLLQLKNKITSLENCPTCRQIVGHDHKFRIEKQTQYEIEEINRELEQKIREKQTILNELESEKKLINEYEIDKNNFEQGKIKLEHQRAIETKIKSDAFVLDRTLNETVELEYQIKKLQENLQMFKETHETFDTTKKEFQNINEKMRIKEITLATKEKEKELLGIRLAELLKEIQNKEKIRDEINHIKGLRGWIEKNFITFINSTEKNVMATLNNEFSEIFSKWFSMLVSDSLTVRLDEEFTPKITNQGYDIEYDFLSGGEKTAVSLAYRLSLNQVLNSMLSNIKTKGLVILDEPTDGFSLEQIKKMREIFDQLKTEQLIIVSHEEQIEGFVDNVKKIQKNGTSTIQNT